MHCLNHNSAFTNFCLQEACLQPLCPTCIGQHCRHHNQKIKTYWQAQDLALEKIQGVLKKESEKTQRLMTRKDNKQEALRVFRKARFQFLNQICQLLNQLQQRIETYQRSQSNQNFLSTNQQQNFRQFLQIKNIICAEHSFQHIRMALSLNQEALYIETESIDQSQNDSLIFSQIKFAQFKRRALSQIKQVFPYLQAKIDVKRKQTNNLFQGNKKLSKVTQKSLRFPNSKINPFVYFLKPLSKTISIYTIYTKGPWKQYELTSDFLLPQNHQSFELNNNIIIVGGKIMQSFSSQILQVNLPQLQVKLLYQLKVPRSNFAACLYQNSIFVLGGRNKSGQLNQCQRLYLSAENVKCQMLSPLKQKVQDGTCAVFDVGLVRVGGLYRNRVVQSVQVMNISTGVWTQIKPAIERKVQKFQMGYKMGAVWISPVDLLLIGGFTDTKQGAKLRKQYLLLSQSIAPRKTLIFRRAQFKKQLDIAGGQYRLSTCGKLRQQIVSQIQSGGLMIIGKQGMKLLSD